ncbi:STM4015 family protein [Thalassoroseus pseudoceratinae]|uniref:STM4015 family protein n=1 Tax=Thalassoroseus pseudoceratinae TaxID=2713176 RepID=UPI00142215A7|nr:STM4015 family protein [Thalassoroseus pseudoceratinae]
MAFGEHAEEFDGKKVVDYEVGMTLEPETTNYRLRLEYDSEESFSELLTDFLTAENVDRVTGVLTGAYSEEMYEESMAPIVEAVIAAAPRLPSLTGLFIGDIIYEENEVSWIQQTDVSPVWTAFPKLRTFQVRGGEGLSLGDIAHDQLKTLIVQTGGMPREILQQLANAQLPELEHLELYLGDSGYGWTGTIADVEALLQANRFPKLKTLGLKNSEIADDVAGVVSVSPIVAQLETLDLSLGTLGDAGAEKLLACENVKTLKKLDLSHHYMSNEMMKQVSELPCEVNVEEQETEEEWGRYVSIGE